MTNREKKAYLSRYISAGREIEDLNREREKWRRIGTLSVSRIDGMPRSGKQGDKVAHAAARLADIERALTERICSLVRLRLEIGRYIDSVCDDTLRRVLYLRYVQGLTFEKIATRMNYTYVHVCRLHGEALNKLGDRLYL